MADSYERFITPAALPTPHEREILVILIEECAEVQQRATKMIRFGRDDVEAGHPMNNAYRLSHEIGELRRMIDIAFQLDLLDTAGEHEGYSTKSVKLARFLQAASPSPQS